MWCCFGENGGYKISKQQCSRLVPWVCELRSKPDLIADRVAFHCLIVEMKKATNLVSTRDECTNALPPSNSSNIFWATLMLMISTPLVADVKIVEVFGNLFKKYHVTKDWVISMGEDKIASLLGSLGMQKKSASIILNATKALKGLPYEPRNYRGIMNLNGVGAKIALVTIQEAHGKAQGIPCDVHMCRIFKLLGWIPSFVEKESVSCLEIVESFKEDADKYNYELARAAMEGWFPPKFWMELNQTWTGLGQLLNDSKSQKDIASYIDTSTADFCSPWRLCDKINFCKILSFYLKLGNRK